ncbi:otogelin [Engraulis encrasicolus]|uniref:otogelin n=1 Tax=Engraulis encrasicolus TaxID=184585 RepID=UPI002FCF489C
MPNPILIVPEVAPLWPERCRGDRADRVAPQAPTLCVVRVDPTSESSSIILRKWDTGSQGEQFQKALTFNASSAVEEDLKPLPRRAAATGACNFPCLNGGHCVHPESCNCSLYQGTGRRCQKVPNTGFEREMTCRSWGQYNFETFDGLYYYFPGKCTYTLVRDCEDTTHSSVLIQIHNDPVCSTSPSTCSRSISLFLPWEGEIRLQNFNVIVKGQSVQLPYNIHDIELERISQYILVTQHHGFTLAWDGQHSSVYIKMSPEYVGRTCGLCGNFNADVQDDLKTSYGVITADVAIFGNSWTEEEPHQAVCALVPSLFPSPCSAQDAHTLLKVEEVCGALLKSPFSSCHEFVSPFSYMASCSNDLCLSGPSGDAVCQVFTEYARACAHAGHALHDWRSHIQACAVSCPTELVYNECITCCPVSCNVERMCIDSKLQCLDGCYCPDDLIFEDGSCVKASDCPCELHGMLYPSGEVVQEECNNCTCLGGVWNCTDYTCPGECSVTGDMYFQSFDGRVYTFAATCQYVLAKSRSSGKFTVTIQNAPCGPNLDGACIQSVNLVVDEDPRTEITMNHIGEVFVSSQYRISLPYSDEVFHIQELSSMFLQVKTVQGLRLQYNWREFRLYLQVSELWKEDTVGLCGTFNGNIQDDFLAPSGMIESTPHMFGNAWRVPSACMPSMSLPQLDPCDTHQQTASYAGQMCNLLNLALFAPCHAYLSPVPFYQQCRADTCKCGQPCLCSALAHYARQCRRFSIIIDFRSEVSECAITCPETMEYGVCVSACQRRCQFLSSPQQLCGEDCEEGCVCPPGKFYSTRTSSCVDRNECHCTFLGADFAPGDVIMTSSGVQMCQDGKITPQVAFINKTCPPGQWYHECGEGMGNSARESKGVACEETCESHLLNLTCSVHEPCIPGCVCPEGLLKHGDECFLPAACPCLWKGKEYFPGDQVTSPCHQCVCQHGTFQCVFQPCPSMCTTYGDRHYRTFDGLLFDYVGLCKVYLVKSSVDTALSVLAENVDCFETGVICRKSLLITIGRSTIAFEDDTGKPSSSSVMDRAQHMYIWQAGYFTIVHIPEVDVTVLWDRKTTVHIQAGPRWQGKLSGLCGNFDLKTVNEMRTPENMDSATPQEFGNSWTAMECVNSPDIRNPCSLSPLREPFAKRQCGLLLSEVFETCHPVVDVTWFYMNCLGDTCGCNRGGDCECFCTSVAAYAHQCCQQGITVDWRSPSSCPYDCEYYNKVLGKGPYQLSTYRERDTVLAANRTSGVVLPRRRATAGRGLLSTFMLTPGLSKERPHDTSLVSFEAAERPNYFLRVDRGGHLRLSKWRDSAAFFTECTFVLHRDTWINGYVSLESFSRPGFFLHYMLSWVHLMKYNHTEGFRRATLFRLTAPSPAFQTGPRCQWRYEACVNPCYRTCSDPSGQNCVTILKVEGCLPLCPDGMVLDEMTQRCVYIEDCTKPPVAVQPITPSSTAATPAAVTSATTTTTTLTPSTTPEASSTIRSGLETSSTTTARAPAPATASATAVAPGPTSAATTTTSTTTTKPGVPTGLPASSSSSSSSSAAVRPEVVAPVTTTARTSASSAVTSTSAGTAETKTTTRTPGADIKNVPNRASNYINDCHSRTIQNTGSHISNNNNDYFFSARSTYLRTTNYNKENNHGGFSSRPISSTAKAVTPSSPTTTGETATTTTVAGVSPITRTVTTTTTERATSRIPATTTTTSSPEPETTVRTSPSSPPSPQTTTTIPPVVTIHPHTETTTVAAPFTGRVEVSTTTGHFHDSYSTHHHHSQGNLQSNPFHSSTSHCDIPHNYHDQESHRTHNDYHNDDLFSFVHKSTTESVEAPTTKTTVTTSRPVVTLTSTVARPDTTTVTTTTAERPTTLERTTSTSTPPVDGRPVPGVTTARSIPPGPPESGTVASSVPMSSTRPTTLPPSGTRTSLSTAGPTSEESSEAAETPSASAMPTTMTAPSTRMCTPPYSEIIDECTKYICVGGQMVLFNKSQSCPYNSVPPNCGLLGFAILVNGDKCCPKWDCPCRCSVFPDLNVITFDGNSVAMFKAASYVVSQLPNETVSILVQECPVSDTLLWNFTNLCLVALNITHKSHNVLINRLQRRLYVNSRYAKPRFKKYGFEILDTGNMYLIRTPTGLKVQWFHSTGMMVLETDTHNKKLPTMGLCGCCDGNPANDLTLSNGTMVGESEDPAVFIDSWQVPNTTSYVSQSRRREVNCSTSDCSECLAMLNNSTFMPCHEHVPPETFCELWVRDAEYVNNPCVALAAYVASCHKFNVCIEWRSPDYCPFLCPESLRYQACLTTCTAQSCPNHEFEYDPEQCSGMTEGCVCPEGTLLHRPYSSLCIPPSKCACTDSFGTPRAVGEVWKASKDGCCMYRCDNDTIVPMEYNCTEVPQPHCLKAGEVIISLADDKSCCPQRVCVCNQSLCVAAPPECKFGEKLVSYFREDSCCPDYACECDPELCETVVPACREDQTLIATKAEGSCCLAFICMCNACTEVVPKCEEGELLTVDANSTDRCCPAFHCVCEPFRCAEFSCPLGMAIATATLPGRCCPQRTCECACDQIPSPKCALGEILQIDKSFQSDPKNECACKRFKCVRDAVCLDAQKGVMRPGQTLVEHSSPEICLSTHCSHALDPNTGYYALTTTSTNCAARCNQNQVYIPAKDPATCCGVCKNISCIFNSENGTTILHKPGQTWVSDCMRYECAETESGPTLVSYSYSCPPFNETECMKVGGTIVSYMDGCCRTCKEDGKSCQKVTVRMTIRKNDCRSNRPVNIVSCDGKCPSASIYNYNINTYARFCKCCREMGLQQRSVQLYCSGNSTWVNYSIQEPTDCSCQWS